MNKTIDYSVVHKQSSMSANMQELLQMVWDSPVFGNAYAAITQDNLRVVLSQVEPMYLQFVYKFRAVLQEGLPYAQSDEIDRLIREIAPKSVAFCSAIAAGEVIDPDRLSSAALCISLVYWADQSMDRGDTAMLAAVRWLNQDYQGIEPAIPFEDLHHLVQSRVKALQWMERSIRHLSRPEDAPFIIQWAIKEGVANEARLFEVSREYLLRGKTAFWQELTDDAAKASIEDVGVILVSCIIYAIYRQHNPELPSLPEIFNNPEVIESLRGPCNAALRVFDDFGDIPIDDGQHPVWGDFCLNFFNQTAPIWIETFLKRAWIYDPETIQSVLRAVQSGTRNDQVYVVGVFVEWVKSVLAALPGPLQSRYQVFITLAKRVVEAGYVNVIGDIELADNHQHAVKA
jgi:hypothetical protein